MAEDKAAKAAPDEDEDKAASGEGEAGAPESKPKSKKKLIIIAVVALLLGGGGGAAAYFTGMIGGHKEEKGEEGEKSKRSDKDRKAYFYDLGDMIVNLSGDGKRPAMLKIKMSVELEDEKDKAAMDQVKPRVLDNFQVYMRELRIEDLKGSAGIYRLREELLLRVAEAAYPAKVRDVLITEMLVQ